MVGLFKKFGGASLGARAMRSSFWTTGSFVSSQVIRLLSNLVLTRLLFPEAFGMMALVTVFIQGLANFSDVGVTPASRKERSTVRIARMGALSSPAERA